MDECKEIRRRRKGKLTNVGAGRIEKGRKNNLTMGGHSLDMSGKDFVL